VKSGDVLWTRKKYKEVSKGEQYGASKNNYRYVESGGRAWQTPLRNRAKGGWRPVSARRRGRKSRKTRQAI